jgi:hypothetical protein
MQMPSSRAATCRRRGELASRAENARESAARAVVEKKLLKEDLKEAERATARADGQIFDAVRTAREAKEKERDAAVAAELATAETAEQVRQKPPRDAPAGTLQAEFRADSG